MKTKEERANIRIDKLKKQLEYKDGIIRELRTHNAGLKVAFDLNAGVTMQMEDLAAKEEAANLKAASFKRSRQELEETTGPAVKKVCLAVKQLGSKKQEVVANGLQVIEASAKIIGPAVAQSKNKKRREERGRSKKGNQYCGIRLKNALILTKFLFLGEKKDNGDDIEPLLGEAAVDISVNLEIAA